MAGNKTATVIGAGVGGLVTAALLAKDGYKVEVFEKNSSPGGRCGQLIRDGYRFDLGATMLMMPGIYRQVFQALGISLFDDPDIMPMKELYRIYFDNNETLSFTSDQSELERQLEKFEPGSFKQAQKYVQQGYEFYTIGINDLIGRNYDHLFQFITLKNTWLLFKLRTYISNYAYAKKFFRNEHLRMAFTFQNIYVGQSPFDAPALFSMIPAAEITEGSYFPKGGMFAIVQKLIKAATEMGVKIHYNSPVKEIILKNNSTTGIVLDNGEKVASDIIVANADLPYVYRKLLPDKAKSRRIDKMKFSSSAVCFHWGVDKIYPQLAHHNVFLSDDYKKNLDAIFIDKSVNERPSFYVHSPARTDPGAAPPGHDAISVVVGTGHLDPTKNQDWDLLKARCRKAVIQRLQQQGLTDLEDHIKLEAVYHPGSWELACNISKGSVFGSLGHNMMQMGYFRPHNQHNRYKNLYFVGGSTQPGNGIPNVLLSAKLTSERILERKL